MMCPAEFSFGVKSYPVDYLRERVLVRKSKNSNQGTTSTIQHPILALPGGCKVDIESVGSHRGVRFCSSIPRQALSPEGVRRYTAFESKKSNALEKTESPKPRAPVKLLPWSATTRRDWRSHSAAFILPARRER